MPERLDRTGGGFAIITARSDKGFKLLAIFYVFEWFNKQKHKWKYNYFYYRFSSSMPTGLSYFTGENFVIFYVKNADRNLI